MTKLVRYGLTPGEMREWEQYCDEEPALKKVQQQVEKREARRAQSQKLKRQVIQWTVTAAAAAVTCFVIIGKNTVQRGNHIPTTARTAVATKHSPLPPDGKKVILALATGQQIRLDSMEKGSVMHTQAIDIIKDNTGHISYTSIVSDETTTFHSNDPSARARLETSGEAQVSITLPDGSEAWLNSASSLSFPLAFSGPKREVTCTGEVYFDIAKNTAQPFIIRNIGQIDDLNIEVLGTSFDVMAYPDTSGIRATLVTGKIRVTRHGRTKELSPGQQLIVQSDGKWAVRKDVSTDEVIAWQQDKFVFSNDSLHVALRKLASWYKVQIEIPATLKGPPVNGTLPRNSSLENLLESISNHKKIFQYRFEHDKMIISQ